ncbi:MAG: hypothetical protein ILP10_03615 [Lachnospiraceae bacterium]|nr:hypothetical protein [Lachnospiraceae bacterium]
MGKVILCYGRKAKTPYIISSTGVKIYTVEELCCYIGTGIESLEKEDLGRDLVPFFRDELGLVERAEYLEQLFGVGATFKDILVGVICSCDYYDADEVDAILKSFDEISSLSESGRKKLKADRLLAQGNYARALALYKSALSEGESRDLSVEEYGNILHNIAVLQIRQGMYSLAADTFLESYEHNGNRETLKEYLFALKLSRQEDRFDRERARLVSEGELYTEINRDLITAENESTHTADMERLEELKSLRDNGRYSEYETELSRLIEELKEQYRSF